MYTDDEIFTLHALIVKSRVYQPPPSHGIASALDTHVYNSPELSLPWSGPMRYLLAILLPPVAVAMCGKPAQAVLNCLLTLLLWLPGMIHALFVVSSYHADQRNKALIAAVNQRNSAGG